jgi:MFS family permease
MLFTAAALALAAVFAPTREAMMSYGWRIIFWFGVVPFLVALFVRLKIGESPIWLTKAKPKVERIPIAALFKRYWWVVIPVIVVMFGQGLWFYSTLGYFGTLLPLLKYPPIAVFYETITIGVLLVILQPFYGLLSDVLRTRKKFTHYILRNSSSINLSYNAPHYFTLHHIRSLSIHLSRLILVHSIQHISCLACRTAGC